MHPAISTDKEKKQEKWAASGCCHTDCCEKEAWEAVALSIQYGFEF